MKLQKAVKLGRNYLINKDLYASVHFGDSIRMKYLGTFYLDKIFGDFFTF